jgi:hypothetical protein
LSEVAPRKGDRLSQETRYFAQKIESLSQKIRYLAFLGAITFSGGDFGQG